MVSSLIALFEDSTEQCTHLGIAFDNPIESFRNDMFDGYKTGAGMEPALVEQMDPVEEACRALGVVVWSMDRWEADDALATAAVRFADEVAQVRIMTPDKDLGQVLDDAKIVQVDRIRQKVIDEAAMTARRGVPPASIPDYLALVGDTADGIPGIPGFGEKSTATVLAHYGTVEAIPTYDREWQVKVRGAKRLATNLAEARDDAILYKKLATLVTDVPLPQTLDDLRWRGADPAQWNAWCDAVGASDSLRRRPRLRKA